MTRTFHVVVTLPSGASKAIDASGTCFRSALRSAAAEMTVAGLYLDAAAYTWARFGDMTSRTLAETAADLARGADREDCFAGV